MKKSVALLAALTLGAIAATPASAERMVLQFLGSSDILENGIIEASKLAGIVDSDASFADVDIALGGIPDDFDPANGVAACFMIDLLNPNTDTLLGTGIDCLRFDGPGLSPLVFRDADTGQDNVLPGTVTVTAISFFIMPGGTVVSMGTTSVQPMVDGFGNGGTPARTHITGSIPDDNAMDGIIAVTGEFDSGNGGDPAGSARVSGSIALDQATPFFDCLWVVNVVSASANGQAHGKPFQ